MGAEVRSAVRRQPGPVGPTVFECIWRLAFVKLLLGVLGLGRAIRVIRTITHRRGPGGDADWSIVERAAKTAAATASFFPGRAMCLEQSLTLWWCLRSRGIDVRLRFGVQPRPFAAHCWVEYGGSPVLENVDRLRQFVPMNEVAP